MKLTNEFAEIMGMFAADGCLQDRYICMWGNIKEDKDYYDHVVCPLFSNVFQKKITAHEKKSNSVYGFYLCSGSVVKLFKDLGFSKNKTYTVQIPRIVLENNNKNIYSAFIRGFFDCDGCLSFMKRKGKYVYFKRTFNTYPRIDIKVASQKIIEDISFLLRKLDIKHTKFIVKSYRTNEKMQYQISVRGTKRVESWREKIGFNNPAKYTKYLIWQKFGMCPTNTTIAQRKLILQNRINPYSF